MAQIRQPIITWAKSQKLKGIFEPKKEIIFGYKLIIHLKFINFIIFSFINLIKDI
ncbi:hypothetical protein AO381_0946 [Moraxella catarrhalis]|nr:hypothetical protein AO381_0946 [Moraxella catarrhalis]OAV05365.1 hypothetical protein AO379_1752 [Moraxella catarrhalis]